VSGFGTTWSLYGIYRALNVNNQLNQLVHFYATTTAYYATVILGDVQWRTEGGFGGLKPPPPRNSEVLTKLSRIPSSVENNP
jgi:hypothetical protein